MPDLAQNDVMAARETRYRRRMDIRVTTQEQAREFVNDVGFCFLFPIKGVDLPSLWDAIAGRVVPTYSQHQGYEIERTWGWKDEALGQKHWYYGKLVRSKATLVSLSFLPNFYALSENFGDFEHDYLEEYRAGRLSAEAKAIYEAILLHGALDAVRLRRESRMSADSAKGRFDRALTELQKGLKVLPTGIAEVGAWRYAFIYELLPRWLPDIPDKAREIGTGQARQAILDQYLRNVIAATPQQAARLFGWTLKQARKAAETLTDEGRLRLDVKVDGMNELQMVTSGRFAATATTATNP
ncbi:MAG: winged helix DNA-binding domain-containing protein [Thermoflexales bacterium]|nr:winged helix DNA-binding domain-containing protein [Thermoflexales bacterium]